MPPYWDNKALSFIFIENKCLSDTIWDLKILKNNLAEGGLELRLISSEGMYYNHYTIEADAGYASILILDWPNHTRQAICT